MAEWPDLDELKQRLNIEETDVWDGDELSSGTSRLSRVLASAIARVKADTGAWDEDEDEPDDQLAQAALRVAELTWVTPPGAEAPLSRDPVYRDLMRGHRKRFAIA